MRALVLVLLGSVGCVRWPGRFAADVAAAAIFTAAVVSMTAPPAPPIVYMPTPRAGYAWQPGYWTLQDDEWVWVPGSWIALPPGYDWRPAHWEQMSDGKWRFMPGEWVSAAGPQS
jgi:hypothetical protein